MYKPPVLMGCSKRDRGAPGRCLILFLVVVIAGHLLPFTTAQDGAPAPQGETVLSFEPLQVCDDGSDFSGFLADHPWVSGSVFHAIVVPDRFCCPPAPEAALSDGIHQAVYRPPRRVLS